MSSHASPVHHSEAPKGWLRHYIFSLDHKIIGTQYILLGLSAVTIGVILSVIMRIHLAWPNAHIWGFDNCAAKRLWQLFPSDSNRCAGHGVSHTQHDVVLADVCVDACPAFLGLCSGWIANQRLDSLCASKCSRRSRGAGSRTWPDALGREHRAVLRRFADVGNKFLGDHN